MPRTRSLFGSEAVGRLCATASATNDGDARSVASLLLRATTGVRRREASGGGVPHTRPVRAVRAGGFAVATMSSAGRLGLRGRGVQRPRGGSEHRRMAVVPVDAVSRRRVGAQHFADGPGAWTPLSRLGLNYHSVSNIERHGDPPFDCCL
jgi:hypothetical protein